MWRRSQSINKNTNSNESFNSYNNKNEKSDKPQNKPTTKYQRKYNGYPKQQTKPKPFVNPLYENTPELQNQEPAQPSEFLDKMREIANVEPECIPQINYDWYHLRKNQGTNKVEYSDDGIRFVPYIGQPFTEQNDVDINQYNYVKLNHYVDEDDPYYISDYEIEAFEFSEDEEYAEDEDISEEEC